VARRRLLWLGRRAGRRGRMLVVAWALAGVLGAVPYGQPTADLDILVSCASAARISRTRPW
jgi:hypothetical protein